MSRQLSKGTLGLKFMNRVAPATAGSPASPAPTNSTAAQSTPPPKGSAAKTPSFELKEDSTTQSKPQNASTDRAPVASTSKAIIEESSLLSFPLLSSTSGYSTGSSSIERYSSMRYSSFTISGRRSFGGANADIELLNNPSLAQSKEAAKESGEPESNSQRKKRDRAEKAASIMTGRATPRSRPINEEDQEQGSAGKKVRLNGGFVKPGGFEGAKRGASGKSSKRGDSSEDDIELDSDNHFEQSEESSDDDEQVNKFLVGAVAAKGQAVQAAEQSFADVDDVKPVEAAAASLSKNQKRKALKKKAAEQADARLASKKK